jgi:hypothetical protein
MTVSEKTLRERGSDLLVINPSGAAIYIELPSPLNPALSPGGHIAPVVVRYLPNQTC